MINQKRLILKKTLCYYFNEIVKIEDFDNDNVLIVKKSYKNILIYNAQTFDCCQIFSIKFDKIDGFIKDY